VRAVRGAPAWLPDFLSNICAARRVSVPQSSPARDTSSSSSRTTVIDQVLARKGCGLQVQSPTVACAGWWPISSSKPLAAQRLQLLVAPLNLPRHHRCAVVRCKKPFVQGRTRVQRVAGTMRSTQTHFSRLWGLSHNKSLLRSGGRWYLECKLLAVIDKVPMTSLGEPPAAELSRYAAQPPPLLDFQDSL
jgi:hypothetical protein